MNAGDFKRNVAGKITVNGETEVFITNKVFQKNNFAFLSMYKTAGTPGNAYVSSIDPERNRIGVKSQSGDLSTYLVIAMPGNSAVIAKPAPNPLLPNWNTALAELQSDNQYIRVLNLGDSTALGANGSGDHYRPNEYKSWTNRLVTAGISAHDDAFFGTSDFTTAKRLYKDLRITGNWTMYSASALGGFMAQSLVVGQTLTFTPETDVDTFRIFWWSGTSGASTSTMQITGTDGTPLDVTISTGGTAFGTTSLRYADVTCASLTAGNAVTLEHTAGTTVSIAAISSWDSTKKQVISYNAGHYGSSTPNWIVTGGTNRNPLDILNGYPDGYFSLVTIKPGINDAGNGNDIETVYKPNLQTIIDAIGSKSDIIIEAANPISSGLVDAYNVANAEIAAANNILFVNSRVDPEFDTYANANAAGLMGDTLHPNVSGLDLASAYLFAPTSLGI